MARHRLILLALAAAAGLPQAGARAATTYPWTYQAGETIYVAPSTEFDLDIVNDTASAQTISVGLNSSHTIASGAEYTLKDVCGATNPCIEGLVVVATSPDLLLDAHGVLEESGTKSAFILGSGSFRILGPDNRTVEDLLTSAAAADSTAFASLQTAATDMQGLLTATSGGITTIYNTLSDASTRVASLQAASPDTTAIATLTTQLGSANAKLDALTKQVAKLTAALPKPKKTSHH